jgi:hypothetical protein
MAFEEGVLPIGQFRHVESQYLDMLKQSPALASTAETATTLLGDLNGLWDFFRRGHFYSENEELEELSTNAVRFFLLPCYIGRCHLVYQDATRPAHLESAAAILTTFSDEMTRLGVVPKDSPLPKDPGSRRSRMISELQEKRALEGRIEELNRWPHRDDLQRGYVGDPIDEEAEQTLVWSMLKLAAIEARGMIRSATDELPFARMHAEGIKPEEPRTPPPKMWVKRIDREEQVKSVFAPLESILPPPLPPDDETWAKPDKPGPKLDASDDEEAEQARKQAAEWDDWKDRHPPFSGMDD